VKQENNEAWTLRNKWNSRHKLRGTRKQDMLLKKIKKSINN